MIQLEHTFLAAFIIIVAWPARTSAQAADEDIWRQVDLREVDYRQTRNYCQRLCGYYRFTDDGVMYFKDYQHKLYRICEGLFEIDIRYSQDEDDGALVLVGRDLVHPDRKNTFMEFFELKPYTFLEKARKEPKTYTLDARGDTTRVTTRNGLAGIIIRDTVRRQLLMKYDALAPDTSLSLNILVAKARLSNVKAEATYWYDEASEDYVPQGQMLRATFDGSLDFRFMNTHEVFNEHTELYIDSVAYFTREQYKAEKKVTAAERRRRAGYTLADIDRMKRKLGVPPLSAAHYDRIEQQRDWDEQFELWRQNNKFE